MAAAGKAEVTSEVPKNQSHPSHLCCYSQRVCNLEKLKGFDFCHKHILEDKASPFKPCDFYAVKNDKRCTNPAPKMGDKEKSYCIIHTRKAELRRAVEKKRKKRRRGNSNTIVENNEESTTEKRRRTSSSASQKSIDESHKGDEGHSSDDDLSTDLGLGGSLKVDSAWHGDVDSDAESVDSEEEDPLRHAGTWTMDEVSKMCCEKMTRLKSLYMAQYKRLFHVLKEKRRKYLQLIQVGLENETGEKYVSPSEILGTTTHSKHHGVEAILHKQAKEKRHGVRYQSSSHQRCTFISDGVRCHNKILPLTKFCIHHISNDPNQLLFQSCSYKTGDDKMCSNVVPQIYSYSTCQLHMTLTPEPSRLDVEKDLADASKQDQEQNLSEQFPRDVSLPLLQEPDKQLLVPKALKQKSSALIPPLSSTSTTVSTSDTMPSLPTITPTKTKQFAVPNLKLEKMDVDPPEGIPSTGSLDSTPMEVMSPASGYSTPAGIQSISPTLLAASLVAVCSAATSPSGTPVLVTSSPSQSTSSTINLEGDTSTTMSTICSTELDKSQGTTIPTSVEEVKSAGTLTPISAQEEASSIAGVSGMVSTEVNKSASTSALTSKEEEKSASTTGCTHEVKPVTAASCITNNSVNISALTSMANTSSSLSTSSSYPSTSDDKGVNSNSQTHESSATTNTDLPSSGPTPDISLMTKTKEPSAGQSTQRDSMSTANTVPVMDLVKESYSPNSTSSTLTSVKPTTQSSGDGANTEPPILISETDSKTS